MREDAKEYLNSDNEFNNLNQDFETMSVAKIVAKLRRNKLYRKKRDLKTQNKGVNLADALQRTAE